MIDRLETEHLILRKAEPRDLDAIWSNIWRDETVAETMLWTPTPTREAAQSRLARTIAYQKDYYGYFVCLKETDEPIGFAGIREPEPGVWDETGICIARAYQSRGYGKETLGALLDLAFDRLGGRRFCYSCFRKNRISAALCRGFGFAYSRSTYITRERDGKRFLTDVYVLERREET